MKLLSLVISMIILLSSSVSAQIPSPDIGGSILNDNINDIVNTNLADDPLRDGVYHIITDQDGNVIANISSNDAQIEEFGTAQNSTFDIVTNIINRLLSILAFVALIYLLYHGFLILSARDDEEQYNKGMQGIRYATIALLGIGLSWFVVSMIFYFILEIIL